MSDWVQLAVHGEDSGARPLRFEARLLQAAKRVADQTSDASTGEAVFTDIRPGCYTLEATGPKGTLPATAPVEVRQGSNRILIVLGKKGEPFYYARGTKIYFEPDYRSFLILARGPMARDIVIAVAREAKLHLEILPNVRPAHPRQARQSTDIGFAIVTLPGTLVVDKAGDTITALLERLRELKLRASAALVVRRGAAPVTGLTKGLLVGFKPDVPEATVRAIAKEVGLEVARPLAGSPNGFLFTLPGAPSYELLDIADKLAATPGVRYAEPNLLRTGVTDAGAPNDVLWPRMTQLPLIGCPEAWKKTGFGSDQISIAVIDDGGVTPGHPDLSGNLAGGAPKLTISYDFVNMAAQTPANLGHYADHGTQCAGAATAIVNNDRGIVGVAPGCRLIGARVPFPSCDVEWSDIWYWAAGLPPPQVPGFPLPPQWPPPPEPAADVIVNAWGPTETYEESYSMSQLVDDCFTTITTQGRGGLGCVLVFSIGNFGYHSYANARPWPADPRAIAVGASINADPTTPVNSTDPDPNGKMLGIDVAQDTRALYSPYGDKLDVVAPSNSSRQPEGTLNDPITSAVRVATGDVNGCQGQPGCMDYADSFDGTSHSVALVGGAAALILSANPALTWSEVQDILRQTAKRIDFDNTDPNGQWVDRDGDGVKEFSKWYGYGRIDLAKAVAEALKRAEGDG